MRVCMRVRVHVRVCVGGGGAGVCARANYAKMWLQEHTGIGLP